MSWVLVIPLSLHVACDGLLEKSAARDVGRRKPRVIAKRRTAPVTGTLIETHCRLKHVAGLESNACVAAIARFIFETCEHRLRHAGTARPRPHKHALHFGKATVKGDAAAADRRSVLACHEKHDVGLKNGVEA